MILSQLIRQMPYLKVYGDKNIEIGDVTCDSNEISNTSLFCAIKGLKTDGHNFIDDAIKKGACAVCISKEYAGEKIDSVTYIEVTDTRKSYALLCNAFYNNPSEKMKVIGVTGTNGKTTTTFMIEYLLNALETPTGLMGTLYTKIGDKTVTSSVTTPDAKNLTKNLADMLNSGIKSVVFEVSSHALSLDRVYACSFDRAVFTNLTQDHLDFHKNFKNYFNAKMKLFDSISNGTKDATAIINADDESSQKIISGLRRNYLTYAINNTADFKVYELEVRPNGISYNFKYKDRSYKALLSISGYFNIYNSLASIATVHSLGFPLEDILKHIKDFKGVKGRFELVNCGQDFSVIVDYAHTPDGLINVLDTARKMTQGRLISVFGCGGDRDRIKRPLMGGIAGERSDISFITSDNPRTEEPLKIIEEIEEGIKNLGKKYTKEADRKTAIFSALKEARQGDTVVIAGKGHENYQILKDKTIHFDDSEIVREYFANISQTK